MPGTIVAAQVLVVLSGLGGLLWASFGVVGGISALLVSGTIDHGGYDTDSFTDPGPLGVSSLGGAGATLLVIGLVGTVLAVVELRCCARLGRADPGARAVLAAVYAIDLLATVILGALEGAEHLGSLTIAVPRAIVVLGLLWLPESSRAAFGDTPPTAAPGTGPSTPSTGSSTLTPAHVLAAPRPTGDRWADEQTAGVAAFCGKCGWRNNPPRQHCGHCGSRLSLHAPRG